MITHDRYQIAIYSGLLGVWTVSIKETPITEGVQFSLPSMRPEFSLPTLPEYSEGTL